MAKLTEEQLAKYRAMDREAFDFADQRVTAFFARAADQGYNLDTTGFLQHPGFFQAPHRRSGEGVDIAMVGSPLDLGAIGLAGARHGPQSRARVEPQLRADQRHHRAHSLRAMQRD